MSSAGVRPSDDVTRPRSSAAVSIVVDGSAMEGVQGQTIAGVLLGAGRTSWRSTARGGRPRGVFCGIGVCFDCIATVNGVPDVRLCQREAQDGDVVTTQGAPADQAGQVEEEPR
ncbi:hypothetical protein GCM10027568_36110 [Humibacter soli]